MTCRQKTARFAAVVCTIVALASPRPAPAQEAVGGLLEVVENLLGGKQPAQNLRPTVRRPGQAFANVEVGDIDIEPDFVNAFTPEVSKVLTAELHFLKKVCDPDDEQFDQIHRAGLLAVAQTSKRYEDLQKIRQSPNQWPDPHRQIAGALQQSVRETMSADVAERYDEEVLAREQVQIDASVGMMRVHIDSELLLTPEQYEAIGQTLRAKWNDSWSRGPRLFMYPQYASMPSGNVLNPHLTERQRSVWSRRPNSTTVNFGWQMELGLQDWLGGGLALPPFDKPAPAKL